MYHSRPPEPQSLKAFADELEALGRQTRAKVGARDARYIRRVIAWVRYLEVAGRGLLYLGMFPPAWLLGTLLLGLAKILENIEVGHNVMHGQYDWMNDPALRGKTYEWDTVATSDSWRRTHNFRHHLYANIRGLDDDVGALRLFPDQPWRPPHLLQPLVALLSALLSQWAVAAQNSGLGDWLRGRRGLAEFRREVAPVARKTAGRLAKDYLIFPLIAGPAFLPVLLGNLAANGLRNVWSWMVILCNHCTGDVELYDASVLQEQPPEHWYYRQVRGSSNFTGSPLFHVLTGHLGYHIEHHLFPDIPACRLPELAPKVREICQRYGVHYNSGSFARQFGSVCARILRYSLPLGGVGSPPVASRRT